MDLAFQNGNKGLLIRRFIAIALMLLSVGCLFWPATIRLGSEFAEEVQEKLPAQREFKRDVEETVSKIYEKYDDIKSYFRSYTGKKLPNLPVTQSEAKNDVMTAYRLARKDAFSFSELRSAASLAASYAAKADTFYNGVIDRLESEMDNVSLSVRSTLEHYTVDFRSDIEQIGDYLLYVRIGSIALNVLFFGLIAFAVLAIVMMLLNRMSVNWAHTVLAFLCAAAFVAGIVIGNIKLPEYSEAIPENPLLPGVGLILMPLFSLAACILYKRDKGNQKAAAPARQTPESDPPVFTQTQQKPVERIPVQSRPVSTRPMQQPTEPGWTCRSCETQNSAQAQFCMRCGEPKPEQPSFCAACGKKLVSGTQFCPFCGSRQG